MSSLISRYHIALDHRLKWLSCEVIMSRKLFGYAGELAVLISITQGKCTAFIIRTYAHA